MTRLKKDTMIKIGVVVAIALVVFFVYRSRRRSDFQSSHMEWVPTPQDNYAEEEYAGDEEEYADSEEYAEEEAEYVEDDYAAEYDDGTETMGLMESTLDDDYANTMFDPSG